LKIPTSPHFREALEEGITHTPGYFLRRGVNARVWKRSPEYAEIESFLTALRGSKE
jgi:hypothetical protein